MWIPFQAVSPSKKRLVLGDKFANVIKESMK